jgi:hypothetical protein
MFVNGAIQRERGAHGEFDGAFVQNRQSARKAEADRANVGVGRIAEAVCAGTENLGVGQKLDVDFQADDGLVFREDLGGDGGYLLRRSRHDGAGIIAPARRAIACQAISGQSVSGMCPVRAMTIAPTPTTFL